MTSVPQTPEIHYKVLRMYALRYLEHHQSMDLVLYFELYCHGPVIAEMVTVRGCKAVLQELEETITNLK